MGVRVVKPDDLEAERARAPASVEMILRIDQEAVRIVGKIACANGFDDFDDFAGGAQKNAAAFNRRDLPRMSDDGFENADAQCAVRDSRVLVLDRFDEHRDAHPAADAQ